MLYNTTFVIRQN